MKAQSFARGVKEEVLYLEEIPMLFYFPQRQTRRTVRMITSKLDSSDALQESSRDILHIRQSFLSQL
jgi:hypothetical protein